MTDIIPQEPPHGNTPATTFIYKLLDPETLEIRYVGKANNPDDRLKQHIAHSRHQAKETHAGYWIASLWKRGLKPILEIIEEVPFAIWEARELYWIEWHLQHGHPLTNTYFGGKGVSMIPPETREKMRKAHLGKKPTPEQIAKRASAMRGMKYKPMSEESRRNIGNAHRGLKLSKEAREKVAASKRGKKRVPFSEEWHRKHRDAMLGRKQSPEHVAKRTEATKRTKAMKRNPPNLPSLWD